MVAMGCGLGEVAPDPSGTPLERVMHSGTTRMTTNMTMLAAPGCYTMIPGGAGAAFRLNRYTGAVTFCNPSECTESKQR